MPNFDFEKESALKHNIKIIAGVDEVGRGALAGPLVAAAVIFELNDIIEAALIGVDDSKKLAAKKRSKLSETIKEVATDFAFGVATVEEIDSMGVGKANILAFKRALDGLNQVDFALIDGRDFHGFERIGVYRFSQNSSSAEWLSPCQRGSRRGWEREVGWCGRGDTKIEPARDCYLYQCLEKGESKSLSIAAASIIAKVYRDELMGKLHQDFPDYGWEGNKGYGSKAHMDTLRTVGACIHHRKSFLGFLEGPAFPPNIKKIRSINLEQEQ